MTVISKQKLEVRELLLMHTDYCLRALNAVGSAYNVVDLAICAKGQPCDNLQQG